MEHILEHFLGSVHADLGRGPRPEKVEPLEPGAVPTRPPTHRRQIPQGRRRFRSIQSDALERIAQTNFAFPSCRCPFFVATCF